MHENLKEFQDAEWETRKALLVHCPDLSSDVDPYLILQRHYANIGRARAHAPLSLHAEINCIRIRSCCSCRLILMITSSALGV